MKEIKFTISARRIYNALGYKSDNFYNWWLQKEEKLALAPDEDYVPTLTDWYVNTCAAEKLIRSSRWCKRPPAVALLQALKLSGAQLVIPPPGAALVGSDVPQDDAPGTDPNASLMKEMMAAARVNLALQCNAAKMSALFETERTPADRLPSLFPFPEVVAQAPSLSARELCGEFEEQCEAAEAVVDADTGELIPRQIDGFVIHQRAKDGYVNATAMCKAAGKMIGNWGQNAETKKVLASLTRSIGIPIDLLVDTIVTGDNERRGTWVHPTVALHLANWCSADFYAAVLTWTINEWTSGNKPAAPAFLLPTTFAEALRLAADTTEENERLTRQIGLSRQIIGAAAGRLMQAQEDLGAASNELAKAQVDLEEEERVNADLVALRALEASSMLLGEWFQRTYNDHGHGEISGRKVMSCMGLLNRELVRGCKHTKEATIPSALLAARKLIYSSACIDKTKSIRKDGPAVPVIDADGNVVKIEPRKILITPGYTTELANWFMTRDETLLRRLVHTRKGEVIHRLKGRYSFYDHDTRSQENLLEAQLFNMVTLVKPTAEDSTYKAYCNVRYNGKDGDSRVVYGEGETLERALYDLAEHYLDGRK